MASKFFFLFLLGTRQFGLSPLGGGRGPRESSKLEGEGWKVSAFHQGSVHHEPAVQVRPSKSVSVHEGGGA